MAKIRRANVEPPTVFYTGVGSRKTPMAMQLLMMRFAEAAAKKNYTLRSGGALGADSAFENGCDKVKGAKEIFFAADTHGREDVFEFAQHFHPNWGACSEYAKKLHARNAFQVLGINGPGQSPTSRFLVCWTPDGYGAHPSIKRSYATGGTGTAIDIAKYYGVLVYNLFDETCRLLIEESLERGKLDMLY